MNQCARIMLSHEIAFICMQRTSNLQELCHLLPIDISHDHLSAPTAMMHDMAPLESLFFIVYKNGMLDID